MPSSHRGHHSQTYLLCDVKFVRASAALPEGNAGSDQGRIGVVQKSPDIPSVNVRGSARHLNVRSSKQLSPISTIIVANREVVAAIRTEKHAERAITARPFGVVVKLETAA